MKSPTFCVLLGLVFTLVVQAQPTPPPAPRGGDGPSNHRVLLATSPDGLAWTVGNEIVAEHASVPELFLGPDGRPVLLFVDASGQSRPGALGALVRRGDGSWRRGETNLRGADPNVVRRQDGTYFAYTKERDGAIVVFSSRDGLDWERRGIAFQDERYRNTTDADVFETPSGWVALISLGPRLLRCISGDGLKFTTDGEVLDLGGSVSDTVGTKGGWRTFFHVNPSPRNGHKMSIRSAFTADGKTWKPESGDRVVAPEDGPARLGVADPAPLQLPDGTWLMAVKSFIGRPEFGGPPQRDRNRNAPGPRNGPEERRPVPPPRGNGGPWNNDVDVWRTRLTGPAEKLATFERAGVPTLARLKDGRLIVAHQHFPENDNASFDKVAVRFSSDEGATWTGARAIRLDGLPEGMRFPFDPTLVPLPDGRVRLYFTSLKGRRFDEDRPAIYSAVSDNGTDYTVEPGMRFGAEGRPVIDCAVVLHQGVFHLFAPDNGTQLRPGERPGDEPVEDRPRVGVGYHATSRDGLAFVRTPDVNVDGRRRWLGNALSDGERITFVGTGEPGRPGPDQPRGSVWMATSTDGAAWRLTDAPVLFGGDPGAVRARDDGWIVVITSEPRRNVTPPRPPLPPGRE
ncbi:MAG: hypothetical protein EXS37_03230 [Opitutus sp.]|nr:hypothetical protein [Opitutus sp.]